MEVKPANEGGQPTYNLLGIGIDTETRNKLQTITTWSKITAIGGFVNLGLNIITTIKTLSNDAYRFSAAWLIVINLISFVITFFLNFFLWQFSASLKRSIDNENQEDFTMAAMQLKAYMRMLGILLIVSIVIGIGSSVFVLQTVLHF